MARKNQRLKGRIVECFGTQQAFSEAVGVSLVSISKKLNGKTKFSVVDKHEWARLLGLSPEEYENFFQDKVDFKSTFQS